MPPHRHGRWFRPCGCTARYWCQYAATTSLVFAARRRLMIDIVDARRICDPTIARRAQAGCTLRSDPNTALSGCCRARHWHRGLTVRRRLRLSHPPPRLHPHNLVSMEVVMPDAGFARRPGTNLFCGCATAVLRDVTSFGTSVGPEILGGAIAWRGRERRPIAVQRRRTARADSSPRFASRPGRPHEARQPIAPSSSATGNVEDGGVVAPCIGQPVSCRRPLRRCKNC
jgi:hypothetical protein